MKYNNVLTLIEKFANENDINLILHKINNIPEDITDSELEDEIVDMLNHIYEIISTKLFYSGKLVEAADDMDTIKVNLRLAISSLASDDNVEKVADFLNEESNIIQKYLKGNEEENEKETKKKRRKKSPFKGGIKKMTVLESIIKFGKRYNFLDDAIAPLKDISDDISKRDLKDKIKDSLNNIYTTVKEKLTNDNDQLPEKLEASMEAIEELLNAAISEIDEYEDISTRSITEVNNYLTNMTSIIKKYIPKKGLLIFPFKGKNQKKKSKNSKIQILEIIQKFAQKYGYSDIKESIDSTPENIENEELKELVKNCISKIMSKIEKNDIKKDEDGNYTEETKTAIIDMSNKVQTINQKINDCDDLKNEEIAQEIDQFLETVDDFIQKYTNIKPERKLETKAGKINGIINANGKKIIIGTAIVVIVGGILLTSSKKAGGNNTKNNKPNTSTQPAPTAASTASPAPTAAPTASPAPTAAPTASPAPTAAPTASPAPTAAPTNEPSEDEIRAKANIVYNSWKEITNAYSQQDIEEVIKALYGLDSNLNIDQADEIIQDVLSSVAIPKVNSILVGTPCENKTVDISNLLLEDNVRVLAIEKLFNTALTTNDLSNNAAASLQEEISAYTEGSLDNLNAAEKIVWARIATFLNAINGTLGEDFYIEYNGKLYSNKDVLDSSFIESIVYSAKAELYGKRKTF